MAGQKLKGRDKIVLQNTKDGVIEKNLADGTTVKVSGRIADISFNLREAKGAEFLVRSREKTLQPSGKSKRRFHYENRPEQTYSSADNTVNNLSDDCPENERQTVEKTDINGEPVLYKSGKSRRELLLVESEELRVVENEELRVKSEELFVFGTSNHSGNSIDNKALNSSLLALNQRAIGGAVWLQTHRQVSKYEDDNQALKAAHGAEKLAEQAARKGLNIAKSANQKLRNKPYEKVSRLKEKSADIQGKITKIDSRIAYQKALNKRRHLQQSRQGAKAAETAKTAVTKSQIILTKIAVKAKMIVASNIKAILILIAAILIFVLLISIFSSLMMMLGQSAAGEIMSSYLSEDKDIYAADDYLIGLENNLQNRIANIQSEYSGFDEYRINAALIGHEPHNLIAFLSALIPAFEFDNETKSAIDGLFGLLYFLEITSITEIRTATYTAYDDDGNPYTVTYQYEYKILEVTLIANDFDEAVRSLLDEDDWELYLALVKTKGNRDDLF
ncbi:MAG: hypothetical protein FWG90_01030 [Oscillospiraceae bacterium]|nr:hypothetical protein [Oscillospiraceae bacterium]